MYRCTSCDLSFESDDKPRCPSCMRMSTVIEDTTLEGLSLAERLHTLRSHLARHKLLLIALPLLITLGIGGYLGYRHLTRPTPPAFAPIPDTLPAHAREALSTLLNSPGAQDLGSEARDLFDARAALHHIGRALESAVAFGHLDVISEGQRPRRAPLATDLLARDALTALLEGQEAHLYPTEISMLLWAAATQARLSVDLVFLDPAEAHIQSFPVPAIRIVTRNAIQAIDPRSGKRVDAAHLPGFGPELLWVCHRLLDARYHLSRGETQPSIAALDEAAALLPDLWTTRALRAELALDTAPRDALHAAKGLAQSADHPWAWLIEARAEAALVDDPGQRSSQLAERLQLLVDAFPFEASLAVELGDHLRDIGRFTQARDAYEQALLRDPDVTGAHTGLAHLYAVADDERAMHHLRNELAEHPDHAPAYLMLAYLHTLRGAEQDAQRATQHGRAVARNVERFDAELAQLMTRAQTLRDK